ncbi:hypothetical protein AOZ06_07890 [Kibdelosporangium phytohabitans]|uniref:Uncharacterized protein n=1 Tax=Kibdelosporangium phytohabitans TaxID=860235 RepID=A0A0N9HXC0_9PSEU|nr:hypothetical protein AOZ06_07890 [Kibdelosporangium phytohabitans]
MEALEQQARSTGVYTGQGAASLVNQACEKARTPDPENIGITAVESLDAYIEITRTGSSGEPARDLMPLYKLGFPILCPEQVSTLERVIRGDVPFGSGTFEIGAGPEQVKPGTYRTTRRSVEDCYWERTRADGEIIQNKLVTHAKRLTVTIKPTDGSFTSERCGTWEAVH